MQEQVEHFLVAIEAEKRAIATVAEQTRIMRHKILHQRKMMGGVNAAKENEYMVQKQVILEHELAVDCPSTGHHQPSVCHRRS